MPQTPTLSSISAPNYDSIFEINPLHLQPPREESYGITLGIGSYVSSMLFGRAESTDDITALSLNQEYQRQPQSNEQSYLSWAASGFCNLINKAIGVSHEIFYPDAPNHTVTTTIENLKTEILANSEEPEASEQKTLLHDSDLKINPDHYSASSVSHEDIAYVMVSSNTPSIHYPLLPSLSEIWEALQSLTRNPQLECTEAELAEHNKFFQENLEELEKTLIQLGSGLDKVDYPELTGAVGIGFFSMLKCRMLYLCWTFRKSVDSDCIKCVNIADRIINRINSLLPPEALKTHKK